MSVLSKISDSPQYFPLYYGFVNCCESKENGKKKYYYSLIFEIQKGTLQSLIENKRKDGLSFQENLKLLECLTFGLIKMKEQNILHQNLKPESILYYQEEDDIFFKLCDFQNLKPKHLNLDNHQIYGSPEFNYCQYNDFKIPNEFDPFKSDIYSVGLILLFANSGDLPFSKHIKTDDSKIYKRSLEKKEDPWVEKEGPYDNKIEDLIEVIRKKFNEEKGLETFQKILERCLKYNPEERLSLTRIGRLVGTLKNETKDEKTDKKEKDKKAKKRDENEEENEKKKIEEKQKKEKKKNNEKNEQKKKKSEEEINYKVDTKKNTGKKCRICKETFEEEKLFKMECCQKRICLLCLRKQFMNEMKAEKPSEINEFQFKCPLCEKTFENEEMLSSIFNKEQYQEYQYTFRNKKNCKVCKKYKESEKVLTLSECKHNICKGCLKKRIKSLSHQENSSKFKLECPSGNCRKRISNYEFEQFDELKEMIEEIGISKNHNEKFKIEIKTQRSLSQEECKNGQNENERANLVRVHSLMEEKIIEVPKYLCEICIDKFYMDEMLTLECDHRFCKECLIFDWTTKINEGSISSNLLICPKDKCTRPIGHHILQGNLPQKLFEKYDSLLTHHTMSNPIVENKISKKTTLEKVVCCPKCNIKFVIDNEATHFQCSECKFQYCSNEKCYRTWSDHRQPCEFYHKNSEEEGFEEYIKKHGLKRCPVCDAVIEKTKNCNYIHCSSNKCQKKTIFCYCCGEILKEKELADHYINGSSFSKCKNILDLKKKDEAKKEHLKILNQFSVAPKIEEKNAKKKNNVICKKCNQLINHMKIAIDGNDCYLVCYNLKKNKCNYFCNICDTTMEKASPLIMITHYLSHLNKPSNPDQFSLSIISIKPYFEDGEFIYSDSKYEKHEKKFLESVLCEFCGKSLETHKKILLNGKHKLPVCHNKFPFNLICKLCNKHITLEQYLDHMKEHKK